MTAAKSLFIAFSVLLISGCSPFKVTTDYDPELNTSGWQTYQWELQPLHPDDPYDNDLNRQRIVDAMNDTLEHKGFTETQDAPDFKVSYFFLVESKIAVQRFHSHHCPWLGCRYDRYETYVSQYKYGSLIIDFLNPETDELQWRGVVGARVSEGDSPEEREDNITAAVKYLMQTFPPDQNKPKGSD
ncbi:DUF4136 domain-containing protein [Litoribacillus peritrichatus]|uniref:DUF4136 domain-containing protein n=1 Tax=Litoribacillus peritrichatus TaxID=718191 RepID=A0ABP7MJP0_9GAMM